MLYATELMGAAAYDSQASYVGRVRVQQPERVDRFVALLKENFNFAALYENLGLRAK